ncbi:hypothetical protein SAMN06265374_1433 [Roseibium denhamense]|uniref:Uncharacterized protein n=1 Tax=Roseibium denhamense TaxID=76305 RepID=A0ABY1NPR3_9HYPH|nr:hypothetical protein SAMN06265374_1433 [Roseibium denhamense]
MKLTQENRIVLSSDHTAIDLRRAIHDHTARIEMIQA